VLFVVGCEELAELVELALILDDLDKLRISVLLASSFESFMVMLLVRMDETRVAKSSVDHVPRAARQGRASVSCTCRAAPERAARVLLPDGGLDRRADDLVQESMLRAVARPRYVRGAGECSHVALSRDVSACIDRLRNRTARKRVEDASPAASPDDPMQRRFPTRGSDRVRLRSTWPNRRRRGYAHARA